jgi:CheY-like chemotaxis protein
MSDNVKLLLVEDNPMVLGLLKGALTPLARVTTANDAADAMLKAIDDPPDVLVSDYRMPGMDGRQLMEKLKSRPVTAGVAVILVATKSDIAEKLSGLSYPVDDFVEKPFFLKEATQRIKRLIDKISLEKMAKAAQSDGVLRGSLLQMNVIDLVQSLEMGRKSCSLTFTKKGEKCQMYFVEGQVTHAVYGDLVGDPAVFKVLRWTDGNFEMNFDGKSPQRTTELNTQGLLMEGLRLLDESNNAGGDDADLAASSGAPASSSSAAGRAKKEEEEDVLLDS